ncbi:FecR domain-containing protein [Chitinophaga sp. 212800010-3]|uniref:FecR family protein n=1 Tax=unclassified Chitinophaga TaxID=2619133 RepID=UPI002DE789E5|nr:FecR family protein [Chitinophaga sp. 212800010-3]
MISDKQHIEQLMLEKLSGCISPGDEQILQQIIEVHPELQQQYTQLEQQLAIQDAQQYLHTLDEHSLWEQRKHHFEENKQQPGNRRLWYSIAAGLLLLAGSGILFMQLSIRQRQEAVALPPPPKAQGVTLQLANGHKMDLSDTNRLAVLNAGNAQIHISGNSLQYKAGEADTSPAMNILHVPAGKDYKLILPDGSTVWLNSMSEISFPAAFKNNNRTVLISGEAYFSIRNDVNRPFIVRAGKVSVNVLGTTFNVNTYSGSPKVSLASGKVALRSDAGNHEVFLNPGFEACYDLRRQNGFSINEFDAGNTLAWMEGKYYFKNASLKDIAVVIRRWFDVTVVFDNADAEKYSVAGVLSKNDGLEDFIDNLSKTTPLNFLLTGQVLHVR